MRHRLQHAEPVQRFQALLAAVAGFADAAERQLDAAAGAIIVDEHLAGADTLGEPHLPAAIGGPDAGDEAKSVPLAMATASSSSSNGMTTWTGPKISSCASRSSGAMPAQQRRRHVVAAAAAHRRLDAAAGGDTRRRRACRVKPSTISFWRAETIGPRSRSAIAGPTRRRGNARPGARAAGRGCADATSMRELAEQVWPAFWMPAVTRNGSARSRSASAKTSCGDLPPSSSVSRTTFCAAARLDQLADRHRAGERDVVDAGMRGQRRAGLFAEARHDD